MFITCTHLPIKDLATLAIVDHTTVGVEAVAENGLEQHIYWYSSKFFIFLFTSNRWLST